MDNMNLEELRKQIDTLDDKLVEILAERMRLSKQVGEVKKQTNTPFIDPIRFEQLLRRVIEKAKKLHLSEDLILGIYKIIHQHSVQTQEEETL